MSKTIIENAGSQLYVYIPKIGSIIYYDKTNLEVVAINNKVTLRYTDRSDSFFSKGLTEIDTPSTTPPNSLPAMVKLIHSYIISGTSSSNTDIKRASYVLSSAEVLALNSTPITIVSGVAGKELQVMSAAVHIKFASAAYATNTTIAIGTTSDPDGQAQLNCLAASSITRGTMGLVTTGTSSNLHGGEDLVISAVSGNPATGNSQVVVDITYREIDLL
jgi:hypothetical protein